MTCSYFYLLLQYLHPILRDQKEASSCFALEKLKTELLLKSFSPSVLVSILPFPTEVPLPLVLWGRRLQSAHHLVWVLLPGRYKACHILTALREIIISFRSFRGIRVLKLFANVHIYGNIYKMGQRSTWLSGKVRIYWSSWRDKTNLQINKTRTM